MDGAHKSNRLYPAYTTAQIQAWLTDPTISEETKEKAKDALAQRAAGNVPFKTPQVPFVDVCEETAYGTKQRLSFQIRVF